MEPHNFRIYCCRYNAIHYFHHMKFTFFKLIRPIQSKTRCFGFSIWVAIRNRPANALQWYAKTEIYVQLHWTIQTKTAVPFIAWMRKKWVKQVRTFWSTILTFCSTLICRDTTFNQNCYHISTMLAFSKTWLVLESFPQ